jgi:hypothetical protein
MAVTLACFGFMAGVTTRSTENVVVFHALELGTLRVLKPHRRFLRKGIVGMGTKQ